MQYFQRFVLATFGRFLLTATGWAAMVAMPALSQTGTVPSDDSALEALSPATLRRMVVRLGSPRLAQREAAERALIELGPPLLFRLPKSEELSSEEIVFRLQRVRKTLELAAARDDLRATRFSLDRDRIPLDRLVEQLGGEKNAIVLSPDLTAPPPVVVLPEEEFTYWELMTRLMREHRLALINDLSTGRPRLEPLANRSLSLHRPVGPLLFSLSPLERREFPQEGANALLFATELTIRWEPRLRPIRLSILPETLRAEDREGTALLESLSSAARWEAPVRASSLSRSFRLTLRPMADVLKKEGAIAGNTIPRLSGEIEMLLPTKRHTFVFADALCTIPRELQSGEVRVQLQDVFGSDDDRRRTFRLGITFENPRDALESYRSWMFENRAALLLESGKRILPENIRSREQSPYRLVVDYQFSVKGAPEATQHSEQPVSFIYVTPTVLTEKRYAFQFDRVPIDRPER